MINRIKRFLGMEPTPDFRELIRSGAVVLDVRTPGEYKGGHIKGSVNIPLDQLSSQMKKFKKEQVIITCCASGMRSASAKSALLSSGFSKVYNGGFWRNLL
jgi:rhodanese-related sulfurtransferase